MAAGGEDEELEDADIAESDLKRNANEGVAENQRFRITGRGVVVMFCSTPITGTLIYCVEHSQASGFARSIL